MKLTTKLITITALLAASALAQGKGECNAGACGQCSYDETNKSDYCTVCHNNAMAGTAKDRKCSGGTAITGCDLYKTTTDGTDGKVYCASCDTAKNYHLISDTDKTKNKCVLCDRSANYLKDGVCTKATVVTGCKTYSQTKDECSICDTGKSLASNVCHTLVANCVSMTNATDCAFCSTGFNNIADKTKCVANIANCATAKTGDASKCKTCNKKFSLMTDETCKAVTATNCDYGKDNDVAKCKDCADGYFLGTDELCAKITVENCRVADGEVGLCKTCMTGFHKKNDKKMCTAMASCSSAYYETTIQCEQCDTTNNYYATDVKGTTQVGPDAGKFWEQVCTKASKIIAASFVALSIAAAF